MKAKPMATDRRLHGCTQLMRIEARHFVAGLVTDEQMRVIRAAPILAWALGKNFEVVAGTLNRKRWRITDIWSYDRNGERVTANGDQSHHISGGRGPIRWPDRWK